MKRISIERILPAPGKITVQIGDQVGALQKIGEYTPRGEIRVVNVAHVLGLDDADLSQVIMKKQGDRVEAGEILAARRGRLPFWHRPCRSPISGRLTAILHGWVVIEDEAHSHPEVSSPQREPTGGTAGPRIGHSAEPRKVDLLAFVAGRVAAITNHRSVTIETNGAHIVGACGVGGEANGVLQVPVKDPTQLLTADDIELGFNNAILVGGAGVSPAALDRAKEMKVRGIIVGGISASLHDLMPALPFPVVATEGYGNLPMSSMAFGTLEQLEGHEVSVTGQMGDGWNSIRPTIIVPLNERQEDENGLPTVTLPSQPTRVGDRVRVVRFPLQGQVGEIVSTRTGPQHLPSGVSLDGAQVAFGEAEHASRLLGAEPRRHAGFVDPAGSPHREDTSMFVPWLNLERIG